uniref:Uncharacterized protein n=1 Tax=Cucumis melo TaxID=3656 RepID=A0A9I9DQY5_CUCME
NNFVEDVHNLEALSDICDTTANDLEQIIQQTRRLNVTDMDRRQRWQGDDIVEGDEEN